MKTKLALFTVGAAMLLATAASAQSASENYSYQAPSGQFGDGTFAWQTYRFRAMDAERTHRDLLTGSILDRGGIFTSETTSRYGRPAYRR